MKRFADLFRLGVADVPPSPSVALPQAEPLGPRSRDSSAMTMFQLGFLSTLYGSDFASEVAAGVIDGASRFLEGDAGE